MNKLFRYISYKLNLTLSEIKSILFVFLTIGLGFAVKYSEAKISEGPIEKYRFNFYDSLSKALEKENLLLKTENIEKRVDSERELSDFSVNNLDTNKKNKTNIKEQSISLNAASVSVLITLPGIGPKTAEKIVSLREKKNGFKKLNELLEVKGIGKVKLENIKKYLYIDN